MDATRAAFNRELAEYKSIKGDIQRHLQTKQQLLSQINENGMVLEELNRLDDDAAVYKLIGPALIRQDMVEAKSNVQKRMDYIKGEMERIDNLLKNLESKANDKEAEMFKLQRKLQMAQASAVQQQQAQVAA